MEKVKEVKKVKQYNVIYNISLMFEERTETHFALFLSGINTDIGINGKKRRLWNRWFDAKNMDDLLIQIRDYSKWDECKYANGKNVSAESILSKFEEVDELKNTFYSCIDISLDIPEEDLIKCRNILKAHNTEKTLFTRKEVFYIATEVKPEFHAAFGFEKSAIILPSLRHAVKTDASYYKQQEVI